MVRHLSIKTESVVRLSFWRVADNFLVENRVGRSFTADDEDARCFVEAEGIPRRRIPKRRQKTRQGGDHRRLTWIKVRRATAWAEYIKLAGRAAQTNFNDGVWKSAGARHSCSGMGLTDITDDRRLWERMEAA
jgi:hypothetical protein